MIFVASWRPPLYPRCFSAAHRATMLTMTLRWRVVKRCLAEKCEPGAQGANRFLLMLQRLLIDLTTTYEFLGTEQPLTYALTVNVPCVIVLSIAA